MTVCILYKSKCGYFSSSEPFHLLFIALHRNTAGGALEICFICTLKYNTWTQLVFVCLREGPEEEAADPENAGGPLAPAAAGQAAVERLQRAAQQEDRHANQGQPSPPKRPFRAPSVPSLCALAIRATVHLMTGKSHKTSQNCASQLCLLAAVCSLLTLCLTAPSMQYSSSLAGLTPELAELLLNHMSHERLLHPRTLELFFGCPIQKFVLNSYPYSTNELLRQLRAFTALKHLSLVNSPLITGKSFYIW